jgi:hypothetical protein
MVFRVAIPRCAQITRLTALAFALAAAAGAHAALWVSPAGDDRNPGTEEQPVRTIERARDIVRTLNREMSDDITVFVAGSFRITRPIEFGPEDSATGGYAIVYTAAPGEHPVVSGGFRVEGWNLADRSRNLWWAPAPEGLADSRDLFVNGVPASRTRGRLLPALAKGTEGGADSGAQWKNPGDVVFPPPEPGAVWSERKGTPPFFVVNAFELLGNPGEWYFDRPAKRIYYTPRIGESMASADVEAAAAQALIEGKGTQGRPVTGLIFKGIRFEFTTPAYSQGQGTDGPQTPGVPAAAVRFTGAGAIQFLEDEFVHLGTPALELGPGFEGGTVEGCLFADISWTALRVSHASQVRIANSRFSYVSTSRTDGAAIDQDQSKAVVIEHSQIDHFPRFAILPLGRPTGASRRSMNLVSEPAIDYEGRPADEDAREAAPSDAGISPAYRALAAERFCAATTPRPPANISAAPGDRLAYVTWDPPCLDGGSPIVSYDVAASGGAKMTVSAATFRKTGFVVFGDLENGHAVNFTVAATNSTGMSPHSLPTANVIPARNKKLKPPQPPKATSVAAGNGETRIQITPPAGDGGSPVLAYYITPVPAGKILLLEGWDVIHADATDPVVRTIKVFVPNSGTTLAVSATNSAGEGKPAILKLSH